MKLFIVLTLAVCAHGGKLDRGYLPPSYAQTSGGSGNFIQTPFPGLSRNGLNGFAPVGNGFAADAGFAPSANGITPTSNGFVNVPGFNAFNSRPQRPQAAFERNAAILRQYNNNNGESYAYGYETENGISAEESGVAVNGVEAQGGYSYTGDDGRVYSVRYTADQNGFRPVGDHLPTPPPIPEEIQRALDQNARDEAAGIFDDGSYNPGRYGTSVGLNRAQAFSANQVAAGADDTIVTNSALILDNDTIRPPGYKNQLRNQARNPGQQSFQPQPPTNFQTQGQIPVQFNGASKAYLPPFVQRNFRNGFRARPSFDARNGYRY